VTYTYESRQVREEAAPFISLHRNWNNKSGILLSGDMFIRRLFTGTRTTLPGQTLNPRQWDRPPYFQFPKLAAHYDRLDHAVFTRHGGTSTQPWDSLNTGHTTGDQARHIKYNLDIIQKRLGAKHLVSMNQVHGQDILVVRRGCIPLPESIVYGDAMITDVPDIALLIKQADCQGIIIFDPIKEVVACIHCGWRGNVCNILDSVIKKMKSEFGSSPGDLLAGIGPSLGPCCAEFVTHEEIFPAKFKRFMTQKLHFDLWETSRAQLLKTGMKNKNIEIASICTKCNTGVFYSYRGEGETGRFATVAMLKKG
jgi:YfiH family protein